MHLERCAACRQRVSRLADVADQLVELLPPVEPPTGFGRRVLGAFSSQARSRAQEARGRGPEILRPDSQRVRRPRRPIIPISATLLTLALGAGGWALAASEHLGSPGPSAPDKLPAGQRAVLYAPLTFNQRVIGWAYLYPGNPSWIYLTVNVGNISADRINCELVRADGSTVPLGTFALLRGQGAWEGSTNMSPESLSATKLVNSAGHTVAVGRFGSPNDGTQAAHAPHHQPDRQASAGSTDSDRSPGGPDRHRDHDQDRDRHPDHDRDRDRDGDQDRDRHHGRDHQDRDHHDRDHQDRDHHDRDRDHHDRDHQDRRPSASHDHDSHHGDAGHRVQNESLRLPLHSGRHHPRAHHNRSGGHRDSHSKDDSGKHRRSGGDHRGGITLSLGGR
jgi:hypothetical protein